MNRPKTVDDVINFILANAPSEGEEVKKNPFKGRRFDYNMVEVAIGQLKAQGEFLDLEAYDISGTACMWHTTEGITNFVLARKATKCLVNKLRDSSKKIEKMLPTITQDHFNQTPINRYQTTLGGMIVSVYGSSPFAALKDLIENDSEFAEFGDFEEFDMRFVPRETWVKGDGTKNFVLARRAIKQMLDNVREQNPGIPLEQLIVNINEEHFKTVRINRYGTTTYNIVERVYDHSPYAALKDLIDNDNELIEFRDLQPYDVMKAPKDSWGNKDGLKLARKATKELIKKLQAEHPDKKLEEIFPVTLEHFKKTPINRYGTTLGGMLANVYNDSPYQALKDLIDTDEEYKEFRDFQPFDMLHAAKTTWTNEDGTKNFAMSRKALKQLFNVLQEQQPDIPLQQIIANIRARIIWETPINKYKTTLCGMLGHVYKNSPYKALKDLAEHDDEFRKYLPVIEELRHVSV